MSGLVLKYLNRSRFVMLVYLKSHGPSQQHSPWQNHIKLKEMQRFALVSR